MKRKTLMTRPEDSGFTVFTINNELNLKDVFEKLKDMLSTRKDNIWWDLKGIKKTDMTTGSFHVLNDFIAKNSNLYPKGKVVIVADTDLSYLVVKTIFGLLRLDGFQGHAQLFRSRESALRWIELADDLSRT